jgi:hypothetical protein
MRGSKSDQRSATTRDESLAGLELQLGRFFLHYYDGPSVTT